MVILNFYILFTIPIYLIKYIFTVRLFSSLRSYNITLLSRNHSFFWCHFSVGATTLVWSSLLQTYTQLTSLLLVSQQPHCIATLCHITPAQEDHTVRQAPVWTALATKMPSNVRRSNPWQKVRIRKWKEILSQLQALLLDAEDRVWTVWRVWDSSWINDAAVLTVWRFSVRYVITGLSWPTPTRRSTPSFNLQKNFGHFDSYRSVRIMPTSFQYLPWVRIILTLVHI